MNGRKEQCGRCGYVVTINHAEEKVDQKRQITPFGMVDMAADIASYATKKASESRNYISGRDMENIIALVGILLPNK
ncbi:hypothetical protein DIX31_003454 [Escherichia coli]|nr:hypothetical protein [Escherichia coli]